MPFGLPVNMLEYRRRLPHFHPDDAYIFLTWRLWGSLPRTTSAAAYAWVVMPNHVHTLFLPRVALPVITRWVKGSTARQANLALARTGQPFRQDESYDHWVRDEKQFIRIARYIEQNPVSAGLVRAAELWPWSSAGWQAKRPAPPLR